ncbi:hypothetical protein K9L27_02035 [Candidatus Gracilibacteria bacterium]|nr:hypothetical protein [Candidatus Gracilibacteria bacterium]
MNISNNLRTEAVRWITSLICVGISVCFFMATESLFIQICSVVSFGFFLVIFVLIFWPPKEQNTGSGNTIPTLFSIFMEILFITGAIWGNPLGLQIACGIIGLTLLGFTVIPAVSDGISGFMDILSLIKDVTISSIVRRFL